MFRLPGSGALLWLVAGSGLLAAFQETQPASISEFELTRETMHQQSVLLNSPHRWTLTLGEGDFAVVEVLAAHAKVAVRLLDPSGEEQESRKREYMLLPLKVRWIAPKAGTWQVEIAAGEETPQAEYSISWSGFREATATDRMLVEADALTKEAASPLEDGDYQRAEGLFRRALELYEKAMGPDHLEVADCLYLLAKVLLRQGQYFDAEPIYKRALSIGEKALGKDHPRMSDTISDLAILYWNQARYAEAEELYKKVAAIDEATLGSDHPALANMLNSLGVLYWRQGRYREAQALYERSLAIREKAMGPEHSDVATSLNNLAVLFETQGRLAEAEPLFRKVLEIDRKNVGPEHPLLAWSLDGLASHYRSQKRFDEAEPLHRQALSIRETALAPDHPLVASSLNSLAICLNLMERYEEAEPLLKRAQTIQEKSLGAEHSDVASTLKNLAYTYTKQERFEAAEPLLTRALAISEKSLGSQHPEVAQGLVGLAEIAAKRQLPEVALPLLDRAIKILDATTGFTEDRIQAYADRARLLKKIGRTREALDDLEEALLAVEENRPHTGGGEVTRAAFFERYSEEFSRMVAWQVEAGELETALEYAERGRARVLLDQLQAGKINLRAGIPESLRKELEAREVVAQSQLAEFQHRITLLRGRTDVPDTERSAQIKELSSRLRDAHEEFRRVYGEIKNASPLWRDLITSGGKPAGLRELQRQIVPTDGLLLLYQLGPEVSQVFVIGADRRDVQAFPLNVDEKIGGLLGLESGGVTSESVGQLIGSDLGLFFAPSGLIEPLQEQLHGLWLLLVPEAIRERVLEAKEVVLVPDGALRNLPFEALLVEPGKSWEESRFWLDEGPPIRYGPSATALLNIQLRPPAATGSGNAGAILLSLADPIYDPMDGSQQVEDDAPGRTRDAYLRAGGPLARLPGTARESDAVVAHFGPERAMALRRELATEQKLRLSLAGRRYLHLATHGLVDEQSGSLFAALALTPPAVEEVASDNDGFLQLYEIYELDLGETELAVLSACETSVGSAVEGEGVFALSRGFLAAGARRVISSHWAVDDSSTAELMGSTFAMIAQAEQQALPVDFASALREAKQKLRRLPRWSAPFYWAPFTLTGKQ